MYAPLGNEIHLARQKLFQARVESGVVINCNPPRETYKEVDVAIGAFLLAGNGTEHPKLLGLVFTSETVNLIALLAHSVKHAHRFYYTKKPPRKERLLKAINL